MGAVCLRTLKIILIGTAFSITSVSSLSHSFASDIAEALDFAQGFLGDDIAVGLEEYVDRNPDEALSILLDRATRFEANEDFEVEDETLVRRQSQEEPFQTLGDVRLNFQTLKPIIAAAADETGLPIQLIDAVIRTESGYRQRAVSRVGASGLMQLMPVTAREMGVQNPFDARQNIFGGARYLRKMYDRFGSVPLAIAAYNAGPQAVVKHRGVPPFKETREYVRTVLTRARSML